MNLMFDNNGQPIPALKFGSTETVATTAASAQSTANTVEARVVRVISDIDIYLEQGTNPTASSSSALVPAGAELILVVPKNEVIAVIRVGASDGTTWITNLV